jgi:hypothetical protein
MGFSLRRTWHIIRKPVLKKDQGMASEDFRAVRKIEQPVRRGTRFASGLAELARKNKNLPSAEKAGKAAEIMKEIITQSDSSRRQAFSNLQLARRRVRAPMSRLDKKLFLLVQNLRRGDKVSFKSKSGNIYTGEYLGAGIRVVEDKHGLIEVPVIRIKEEDDLINLLRVDKLKERV